MPFVVTPDALDALASEFRHIAEPLNTGRPSVGALSAPVMVLQAIDVANRHLMDGIDTVHLEIDAIARDLNNSAARYRINEAELVAATGKARPTP
jgi:hypothetical protein